MQYETHKDAAKLSFVFEGDNAVDASAVSKALDGLTTITSAIAIYEQKEVEYRLSVLAFKPGSFSIALLAVAEASKTLLSPDGMEYAVNLADAIAGCFKLKRFLKGKLPKEKTDDGEFIVVRNSEGAEAKFPKGAGVIFVDQRVDNSINYTVGSASASNGVSGIRVDTPKNSVRIERNEFDECSIPLAIEDFEAQEIESLRLNEILFIRQPDLLGDSKWGFKGDKNFTAEVTDTVFLERIRDGTYTLYSGMYIVADLLVTTKIRRNGMPDEKPYKFTVKKVHSVSRQEDNQTRLYDNT